MDFSKVYDILVQEAGAVEDERESFLHHHPPTHTPSEWRFRGKLGFGGKFRCDPHRKVPYYVSCYHEDRTPERAAIEMKVNNLLKDLHSEESRNSALEKIAQELLDVPTLTLSNPFTEARVKLVDLKQALQLAYKAGQDSK